MIKFETEIFGNSIFLYQYTTLKQLLIFYIKIVLNEIERKEQG